MAGTHSLHLPRRSHRRSDVADPAAERDTDAVKPGEPTKRGGRVLVGLAAVMAVVWLVSLIQIFRLPVQGPLYTSGEAAIWTALAIVSAISTFLLGIWKIHRS
jgi:hypothetical protein